MRTGYGIATVARYGLRGTVYGCTARVHRRPFVVRQNWTRVAADRDVPTGTVSNQYASTHDSKVHGNKGIRITRPLHKV